MSDDFTVFVVDDDRAVRNALALLLKAANYHCQAYDSAQAFLEAFDSDVPGCAVLDIQMPGMSGLQLQQELADSGYEIPVIFLTGHGDVPAAVQALKDGAVDFLEKPINADRLIRCVQRALHKDQSQREASRKKTDNQKRLAKLTPREAEILELVLAGTASKVIAMDLTISERTVEIHRSHIMKKLEVRNLAQLMRTYAGTEA